MRASPDLPRRFPVTSRRGRWALAIGVIVLIILIAFLQRIASFYTDFLWFKSLGFSSVWSKTVTIEIGLAATFSVVLFVLLWSNLVLADRLGPHPPPQTGDMLVSRWQSLTEGRAKWPRLVVAIFFAIIGGASAHSQWGNWLLFSNSTPFTGSSAPWGGTDPLNHLNVGFYVFTLPFLNWVVGWVFSALVLTLLLTLLAHYLNGGVRPHSAVQRVSPRVKAHLSVLLAVLALVQGVSYYLTRLSLVLSTKYVVDGATYTDVHAVRPALILLIAISVIAAGLFLYNARQQGWLLPSVAVALWGLVWVLVLNVYPAAVQAFVVNPAENVKEAQYIERNIAATTYAYGLDNVSTDTFTGDTPITTTDISGSSAQAQANRQTLANVRLLDPQVLDQTITKQQGFRGYYDMSGPSTDRYVLPNGSNGRDVETQVLISARQLNQSGVPASWVNTHLQYTHGYGAVVTPANEAGVDASNGYPNYDLAGLPPSGQPALNAQPRIYYDASSSASTGYVVAGTSENELDYEDPSTSQQNTSHYSGPGGVPAGGIVRRLAFAISFGDYNMLLSGAINPSSKVLYYRNVTQRLEKAAPFLSYDSDPYPVVVDGRLYWVDDAYTTTDNYPYAEQAGSNGTARLQSSSGLYGRSFNYVRNSVKAVVDAYTGKVWFFVFPPSAVPDPVIATYEKAFPKLFTPMSLADKDIPHITDHWRYPEDIFTVQTNMYTQYHQQNASVFYSNSQEWSIAQNPASGEVGTTTTAAPLVPVTLSSPTTPSGGQALLPQYELIALPGQTQQSFVLVEPFVPFSNGEKQNLTAFMTAASDPDDYGQLTIYDIPSGEAVDSPFLVSTAVETNQSISQEITLLGKLGSKVVLGNVIMTPVSQSLLYIQPLYVEQENNGVARLDDVIVVYDGSAFHSGNGTPSLAVALCNVTNPSGGHPFDGYCAKSTKSTNPPPAGKGHPTKTTTTTTTTTTAPSSTTSTTLAVPSNHGSVAQDLAGAQQDFADANAALRQGDFATYENDLDAGEALVAEAAKLVNASTTTTTSAGGRSTTSGRHSTGGAHGRGSTSTSTTRSSSSTGNGTTTSTGTTTTTGTAGTARAG